MHSKALRPLNAKHLELPISEENGMLTMLLSSSGPYIDIGRLTSDDRKETPWIRARRGIDRRRWRSRVLMVVDATNSVITGYISMDIVSASCLLFLLQDGRTFFCSSLCFLSASRICRSFRAVLTPCPRK
jgi:hypothetical protein